MDKKELDDLYSKSFAMNVQLSSEYSVVAVASVHHMKLGLMTNFR